MDGSLALSKAMQQMKEMKWKKKKKKQKSSQPIKVVYISSPMKIKASVSEFRALVQEFTGQDAEFPDPSKFPMTDEDFSGDRKMDSLGTKSACDDYPPDPVALGDPVREVLQNSSSLYDVLSSDQMVENFSGVWPSNLLFES